MAYMKLTNEEIAELLAMYTKHPYRWGNNGKLNLAGFSRYFGVPQKEIKRVEQMLDNKQEDIV